MAQHARIKRTPPPDGARRRWWQNRLLQLLAAFVLLCGVAAAGLKLYTDYTNSHFQVTFYRVTSSHVSEKLRVLFLSDLHLREYGEHNEELIQTVQVPSGSDFAEASISVDWDQWAEIHLLFQPKLTGTTTYSIYFYDTVNKHSASLAENQSGIWGAVLYPMFDKTRSMTGHTWQGSAISATALYQNLGFLCTSVARGSSIAAGTTMTIYGRK